MRINEIFHSLQGEGILAGVPSTFIRLPGCSLRCKWCDTKYAWELTAGIHYNIDKIIQTVQQNQADFLVITGVEPMINEDLPELIKQLKTTQKHITIETAGIAFIPDMPCDLMSISPKLTNSVPDDPEFAAIQENARLDIAILSELIDNYNYQLKFVVDSENDMEEIGETIEKLGNVDLKKVMLMPQAKTRDELLSKSPMVAELCKQTGFSFSPRLQILLWDNERAT